eukprot:SAG11_NODE_543_length_8635_cov_19.964633_3_plen_179_part_00
MSEPSSAALDGVTMSDELVVSQDNPLSRDGPQTGSDSSSNPLLAIVPLLFTVGNTALFVAGFVMLVLSISLGSYGTDDMQYALIITALFAMVTGGVGVLAAMKEWWAFLLMVCMLQSLLFFVAIAIATVSLAWSTETQSPISEAVDDHWNRGVRASLETDLGDSRMGFCDPSNGNSSL